METIKLDLIPGKKMPSLHASQYDDGREHGIDLFENGVVYKLDGTETLTINERKGDDCICSLDIENTFAGSNHIVFASTEQMCAVWGNNICELVIAKGEKTIGTLNFILEIEPSPTEGGIESESEIKNLKTQIEAITEEVIGDDYYTKTQTDNAIANATEGKADTTYVDTELAKKADKSNTYTKTEVDTLIDNLPEPMIFKGTLGVGGTIQTLPTASTSNEGYTYKVITDGTYAGQTAKVGDVFTSNGSAWVLIPSGDEDNDTWRAIKVEGVEVLGNGISSGAVDFVGSENIEVDFDGNGNKVGVKTKNIYTKEQVDDIVYGILPDDTASGSIANFETDLALPLKSLEIDVNAVQESGTPTPATPLPISGWSEISLVKRGANLWDEVVELGALNSDGTLSESTTRITTDFIPVKPNQTYRQSSLSSAYGGRICFYDINKRCVRYDGNGVREYTKTFTTQDGEYYVRITLGYQYGTTYNHDISINYPSSDTVYHAYNPNGNTEVINLGGTYYGGKLDVKTGLFRADVRYMVFDGTQEIGLANWRPLDNSVGWLYKPNITPNIKNYVVDESNLPYCKLKSNRLKTVVYGGAQGLYGNDIPCISLVGTTLWGIGMRVNDTSLNNATAINNWLSQNPIEVIYELETPIEIQLTPTQVTTLIGTNNIFADTGDTSVVFKNSVNGYVEKKIASVQALALNT